MLRLKSEIIQEGVLQQEKRRWVRMQPKEGTTKCRKTCRKIPASYYKEGYA